MLLKHSIYHLAFLALLAIAVAAKPQCDPNKINALDLREASAFDDTSNLEARDASEESAFPADESWDTVTTVSLADDEGDNTPDKTDADALNPLAQNHCSNCAKIKKVKPRFNGKCNPKQSLGWKSSHNCKGSSYLCVQNGQATCYGRPLSHPKHLLPVNASMDVLSKQCSARVTPVESDVRDELVDLYLELIHDKPHTLFHPGVLKTRIRDGSLPNATLYSIMAFAARFSKIQGTRAQAKALFQSATNCVKMSIDDICLDNVHATILIGNLCGADGDPRGEALYFGVAFRMAQILHLPEPAPEDDALMTESKLRTWWSLYMIDQWSSAGLNIPRQIQDTNQYRLPMSELVFQGLAPGQPIDSDVRPPKPGLWGYMVILVKIFGHIQHLHRQLADGTLDDSGTESATRQLANELDSFIQNLPTDLQLTIENMREHASLGIGRAFVALHLGFHHYATLLYFPYLGTQLSHVPDHELFASRCKYHAAAFSDLLRTSDETESCEALYFIVAHMTVTSSSALLHALLFGKENELFDTKRRLYYNFQILLRLKSYWPGVDLMIERLFTFQKACMLSMDRIYTVDRWIVKFLLQHALPIEGNLGPPVTSRLAERDKFASDALSMLRPEGAK
ncbi:hypothetical protein BBP40_005954 [Aspergillus hancockii]|nr:hypothetical protein BBP40_005954 [Aspergillus hancockii]